MPALRRAFLGCPQALPPFQGCCHVVDANRGVHDSGYGGNTAVLVKAHGSAQIWLVAISTTLEPCAAARGRDPGLNALLYVAHLPQTNTTA